MGSIAELRAQARTYSETAANILTGAQREKRNLTPDEQKTFDGLMSKIDALKATITRADTLRDLQADLAKPFGPSPGGGDGYVRRGELRPGEVRTFKPKEKFAEAPYDGPGLGLFLRGITSGNWKGAEELRAMSEGTLSQGGYLVPQPLAQRTIDLVRSRTRVMEAGAITVGMTEQTLKMARLTQDVTAAWKVENAPMTFSDAAFDSVQFNAQVLIAGAKLSVELVEDAYNIDKIVERSISLALALELDRVALYGSGAAPEPKGVKNQSGVTTVSYTPPNGAPLLDYSQLSKAISVLLQKNFEGPFGAILNPRTIGDLDNLQDTLHQPMRQPPLVTALEKFPTSQVRKDLTYGTSSNASDIFIAQWDQLMIGIRDLLVMEVSRQASDASSSAFSNLQYWIRAFLRADVALQHPAAFYVLTGVTPV